MHTVGRQLRGLWVVGVAVSLVSLGTGCDGCDGDESAESATQQASRSKRTGTEDKAGEGRAAGDEGETAAGNKENAPGVHEQARHADTRGASAGEAIAADVPDRGCARSREGTSRVWAFPGIPHVSAVGSAFVVAGYARPSSAGMDVGDAKNTTVFVARIAPGERPRPLHRHRLQRPFDEVSAPPAVATAKRERVAVVTVDRDGTVRLASMDARTPSIDASWHLVGEGADPRFPPAVTRHGPRWIVAWVGSTDGSMHVQLARVSPKGVVASRHRLAPKAGGATAPAFVRGEASPELLMLDAREGISPILRTQLDEGGRPQALTTMRSVSNVYEPPQIAAVRVGDRTWVAYTAVGNAATTAVGLVPLGDEATNPVALVPGAVYGRLGVAAAAAPAAGLFAISARREGAPSKGEPSNSPSGDDSEDEKHSRREVRVRLVDDTGPGPAHTIRASAGNARQPAIGRSDTGHVAVAFRTPRGVRVAWLQCDDE